MYSTHVIGRSRLRIRKLVTCKMGSEHLWHCVVVWKICKLKGHICLYLWIHAWHIWYRVCGHAVSWYRYCEWSTWQNATEEVGRQNLQQWHMIDLEHIWTMPFTLEDFSKQRITLGNCILPWVDFINLPEGESHCILFWRDFSFALDLKYFTYAGLKRLSSFKTDL